MNRINARFRVVTPLFLSGARQDSAELRLPSFKGALRFWWRAVAAQHYGTDIQKLRDAEDEVFGSTRTGISRVRMRVADKKIDTGRQNKFDGKTWRSYVGFGLIDKPGQASRVYIQPGSWFSVELSFDRCDEQQRTSLQRALIALGLCGGLGGRVRNGWGSVTLETLSGIDEWHAPTDVAALEKEIERLTASSAASSDWTAFSSQSAYMIGKPQAKSESAHQAVAQQYQEYVKSINHKQRREGLGLPRTEGGPNANRRRASPVWLHVHQPENAQAIPLALFLPARFLQDKTEPSGGWETARAFVANGGGA